MLLPAAAAVCALVASRCYPLEVLAGTSRPPVSLGSSSGCASRACGGRCPAAAAVCALAASRCCPLEVLAGTPRPPVSLGSSSGCASRACGGRCCTRRRAAHGDAAQGYQGYEDDAAPCGRHGLRRPRRGVGAGAHTLTPFGVSAGL
ncbi:hypothetical protein T492DRAFT_1086762 [Pavlovales sp. CCMP2436]|nr:hypothetical protein T492DRAFT_1086762 [Pavlovales sp. CCMP2436]